METLYDFKTEKLKSFSYFEEFQYNFRFEVEKNLFKIWIQQ